VGPRGRVGRRFELGLGTQVRGNIERRYSTPWTAPVARMREYVRSLREIFRSFQTGAELSFEGEHYRFTRLQPFFNPVRSRSLTSRSSSAPSARR
jgi:alkanesulfonate monooxygenase SsuD/methylene tetrahydromethanopterin reductase-like flavin-dependent oxidoreductase (luciferase family)